MKVQKTTARNIAISKKHYNNDIEWMFLALGQMMARFHKKHKEKAASILHDAMVADDQLCATADFIRKDWNKKGVWNKGVVNPFMVHAFLAYQMSGYSHDPNVIEHKKKVAMRFSRFFAIFWAHVGDCDGFLPVLPQFDQVSYPPCFVTGFNYYPNLMHTENVCQEMWEAFSKIALAEEPTKALTKDMWDASKRWYRCNSREFSIMLSHMGGEYFYPLTKANRIALWHNRGSEYNKTHIAFEHYRQLI